MRIGELAKEANCTTETIRFYEKEGLLTPPERTDSNYRSYNQSHIERLRFIRNCRSLDMAHEEIRALLAASDQPQGDCSAVNALLDEHIAHVDARIEELTRLRQQLTALRTRCNAGSAVDECGIMQGLTTMETKPSKQRTNHLG